MPGDAVTRLVAASPAAPGELQISRSFGLRIRSTAGSGAMVDGAVRRLGICQSPLRTTGDVAQLAEHCLCKAGVRGSIPLVSTKIYCACTCVSELGPVGPSAQRPLRTCDDLDTRNWVPRIPRPLTCRDGGRTGPGLNRWDRCRVGSTGADDRPCGSPTRARERRRRTRGACAACTCRSPCGGGGASAPSFDLPRLSPPGWAEWLGYAADAHVGHSAPGCNGERCSRSRSVTDDRRHDLLRRPATAGDDGPPAFARGPARVTRAEAAATRRRRSTPPAARGLSRDQADDRWLRARQRCDPS